MSLHHEKVSAKKMKAREDEIKRAVQYCQDNNCKGYKALKNLDLQFVKDARTINQHLFGKVTTGLEKQHLKILTEKEEASLVKYLINRNRACQGLNDKQVEGVVLNILRVRKNIYRKGGRNRGIPLSQNAKRALESKHLGKSFFRRFNTKYPQLKRKKQQKVSAKRGLRCTRQTAIEYIDDLSAHLIELGIAPELIKQEPGIWNGKVDLSRIWAHDETPQFINYGSAGQSKKKIYAGAGHDCNKMTKENRESVTVHPFSNFSGETNLCQVIFSGSGMSSHMCPPAAASKIENLLISVNEKGCTTSETLYAAYQELTELISKKKEQNEETTTDLVIADGHKTRFQGNVMDHCSENHLDQFILPPDTSGVTQMHDQINQLLYAEYEKKKTEMYSEYSDINKECFMNILADIWSDWTKPERIVKAAKRVGISQDGLCYKLIDQSKFEQAEAIMNPPTHIKTVQAKYPVNSPKGMLFFDK